VAPSNIDVVRANSAAFSRCDADGMLALYAPDAVVVDRRSVGWGEFSGHDALHSYYQGIFDNADGLHEDLEIVAEHDDVIVASCDLRARLAGQPDADEVTFHYAIRITLADGLITSIEIFEDASEATAAGS
jgi:ketosteroid isomerase-like protein